MKEAKHTRTKHSVPAAREQSRPFPLNQDDEEGEEADRDDDRVVGEKEKRGEFISLEELRRWWRSRRSR